MSTGDLKSIGKLTTRIYDSTLSSQTRDAFERIADEIEQEIAERFMELPVDADGVPIHVGDKMRFCDFNVQCAAVSPERIYYWDEYSNGHWVKGRECRHVKPRTIEDVLKAFFHDALDADTFCTVRLDDVLAKYADEIRELTEIDR